MRVKAESFKQYNEAAVIEMIVRILPEVVCFVFEPLSKMDKMESSIPATAPGGGASKLTGDVTQIISQLPPIIESLTGVKFEKMLQQVPALKKAIGKDDDDKNSATIYESPRESLLPKQRMLVDSSTIQFQTTHEIGCLVDEFCSSIFCWQHAIFCSEGLPIPYICEFAEKHVAIPDVAGTWQISRCIYDLVGRLCFIFGDEVFQKIRALSFRKMIWASDPKNGRRF